MGAAAEGAGEGAAATAAAGRPATFADARSSSDRTHATRLFLGVIGARRRGSGRRRWWRCRRERERERERERVEVRVERSGSRGGKSRCMSFDATRLLFPWRRNARLNPQFLFRFREGIAHDGILRALVESTAKCERGEEHFRRF